MGRILGRVLRRIGRFIHGFFSIGISLRAVVILLVLVGGGMYYWTYNSMLKRVGGKEDFDEAMRYIEIKDLLDEKFIEDTKQCDLLTEEEYKRSRTTWKRFRGWLGHLLTPWL